MFDRSLRRLRTRSAPYRNCLHGNKLRTPKQQAILSVRADRQGHRVELENFNSSVMVISLGVWADGMLTRRARGLFWIDFAADIVILPLIKQTRGLLLAPPLTFGFT